jgi:hypothetical protein
MWRPLQTMLWVAVTPQQQPCCLTGAGHLEWAWGGARAVRIRRWGPKRRPPIASTPASIRWEQSWCPSTTGSIITSPTTASAKMDAAACPMQTRWRKRLPPLPPLPPPPPPPRRRRRRRRRRLRGATRAAGARSGAPAWAGWATPRHRAHLDRRRHSWRCPSSGVGSRGFHPAGNLSAARARGLGPRLAT